MGDQRRAVVRWWSVFALLALSVACESDSMGPEGPPLFVVDVSGEEFHVQVNDSLQVDAFEARMATGERGVIIGPLQEGHGGFNQPWGWHLDPDSVAVADLAIELCDGRPSLVEADLAYWFGSVGQFCPWGALVVRRIR